MAVDRRAVFTDAVVFARIRQLNALGEVKPGLLTIGEMGDNPGVKQEIVVISFSARNGIRRANLAAGDILLLGIADKIIDPVFRPLITYAAADSEDVVQVIAGLQERRQVGNAVAGITAGGVDSLVIQIAFCSMAMPLIFTPSLSSRAIFISPNASLPTQLKSTDPNPSFAT